MMAGRRDLARDLDGARRRALAVEFLGPAGAGKTSLVRYLEARDEGFSPRLSIPARAYALPWLSAVARFMPVWATHHRNDRWFDRRELRSIAKVVGWHRGLRDGASSAREVVAFDHGPLYRLSFLPEFGPDVARSPSFEKWRNAWVTRWIDTLDLVVWLDAPDDVLLRRLDHRGHHYLTSAITEDEQHRFLERYRRAFESTVHGAERSKPNILHLRSDQMSTDEAADRVSAALEATRHG